MKKKKARKIIKEFISIHGGKLPKCPYSRINILKSFDDGLWEEYTLEYLLCEAYDLKRKKK